MATVAEIVKECSDKYNALPDETRKLCSVLDAKMRINQLVMEKARLIKRHQKSLAEIRTHVKNLEQWILKGRG